MTNTRRTSRTISGTTPKGEAMIRLCHGASEAEVTNVMAICKHCLPFWVKIPPWMAITTMIARRGQVPLILPYSISLTLVCDVNKKFTSYLAGYPGSCHNSYVLSNMQISQQPEKFFDKNQFLLADSAYTSDWFTLPAYKGKELLDHQNVDFNYHLAQSQVRIEHAIGILKEMKDTIKWIISCVILHNLLADLKDQ
ncbi:hypothetical protein VP01_5990g2 [Puccinia sorghi]|uniref:DDE Tnp4 domain-containing protein n=1 Tax=Puccinia sorghi TaxID=27349 RepID=A0A0L6UJL7_9BASI|nr:hypothetical protein VP01_5990g2 [Puccinia sorghi]